MPNRRHRDESASALLRAPDFIARVKASGVLTQTEEAMIPMTDVQRVRAECAGARTVRAVCECAAGRVRQQGYERRGEIIAAMLPEWMSFDSEVETTVPRADVPTGPVLTQSDATTLIRIVAEIRDDVYQRFRHSATGPLLQPFVRWVTGNPSTVIGPGLLRPSDAPNAHGIPGAWVRSICAVKQRPRGRLVECTVSYHPNCFLPGEIDAARRRICDSVGRVAPPPFRGWQTVHNTSLGPAGVGIPAEYARDVIGRRRNAILSATAGLLRYPADLRLEPAGGMAGLYRVVVRTAAIQGHEEPFLGVIGAIWDSYLTAKRADDEA